MSSPQVVWKTDENGYVSATLTDGTPVAWAPQPGSQQAFLACPTFELLLEGPRGTGKSSVLIADFLQCASQHNFSPYFRGIIFRERFEDMKDIIAETRIMLRRAFPDEDGWNQTTHTYTFKNGAQLIFGILADEEDYDKQHGKQYAWMGFEEITTLPDPTLYLKMFSCARSTAPGIVPRIRLTTNPSGISHGWVKDRFRLPLSPGRVVGHLIEETLEVAPGEFMTLQRRAIHSSLSENKVLLSRDPNYAGKIAMAAKDSPDLLAAWIVGSWDIVEGGIFSDIWKPSVHVIEPFAVPTGWRIDRSFDWGGAAPFSILYYAQSDGSWYITPSGRRMFTVKGDVFVIAEWYGYNGRRNHGLNLTSREISKGMIEREFDWGWRSREAGQTRIQPGPADTNIWTRSDGRCIAEDMERPVRIGGRSYPGIKWVQADKGPDSVVQGIQQVREYLKGAMPAVDGLARETPGLFVFNNCTQFILTVPNLQRDKLRPETIADKQEDHCLDSLRYRLRHVVPVIRQRLRTGGY